MILETNSPTETYEIGLEMGRKAVSGQVYALVGDLGVGKTTFTQGFARGLGIEDVVCSPTFTIVQEYLSGKFPFYHLDVYRIGDTTELEEIGFEEYVHGEGVTLIEWANLIDEALPEKHIEITIEKDLDRGFDYRRITIGEKNESISN